MLTIKSCVQGCIKLPLKGGARTSSSRLTRLQRHRGLDMNLNSDFFLRILDPLDLDRKGKLNFLFGVTLLPMLMMVGSVMDYAGALTARVRLQGAAETASLALVQKLRASEDQSQFNATVDSIFNSAGPAAVGGTSITSLKEIIVDERQVCIRATSATHPAFMKIAGVHELQLRAESCRSRTSV